MIQYLYHYGPAIFHFGLPRRMHPISSEIYCSCFFFLRFVLFRNKRKFSHIPLLTCLCLYYNYDPSYVKEYVVKYTPARNRFITKRCIKMCGIYNYIQYINWQRPRACTCILSPKLSITKDPDQWSYDSSWRLRELREFLDKIDKYKTPDYHQWPLFLIPPPPPPHQDESSLNECSFDTTFTGCSHDTDTGVICQSEYQQILLFIGFYS